MAEFRPRPSDGDSERITQPGGFPLRPATMLLRDFLEVSEAFERMMRRELKVNATDLEMMENLIASGPLPPSELSERLAISTASMTTAIDRLEALGHVTREPHPTDRRRVLVVPTEDSRREAMSLLMPMILAIDAEIDHFTDDEQRVITDYLTRVVGAYRRRVTGDDAAD